MARNKHPEETVNRILDAALELFIEKGYENTTIKNIVDNLEGLSRGAIYHHFKSKEEIIDAVSMRLYEDNSLFNTIKNDVSLNGLQKLKQIFIQSIMSKEQQQLYRSSPSLMKNPKFLSRQLNQSVSVYAPLIQDIIEEGIQDESIHTKHSKELSEVLMVLVNIWLSPAIFTVTEHQLSEKMDFLQQLFDGIGLKLIDDEIMIAFKRFCRDVF